MQSKLVLMLIVFGVVCLLQTTPTQAAVKHVKQLMKLFRGMYYDWSKKPFYLQRAKYGVQTLLRDPLCTKAKSFPNSVQLSDACLKEMLSKVYALERSFHAGFSFNCDEHEHYSVQCLDEAEPKYLRGLTDLAAETEKCLVQK